MVNSTPFFKPKEVKKKDLNIKSESHQLFTKTVWAVAITIALLLVMFIVYQVAKKEAPEVIIQTQTQYDR